MFLFNFIFTEALQVLLYIHMIQVKSIIRCMIMNRLIISTGFGLAFNLQPALTIIGTYFQIKRPLANGVAMTGSPVILFTLAPLHQFLFDYFGWRGSFFILGSIVLNCYEAALFDETSQQKTPNTNPRRNHQFIC